MAEHIGFSVWSLWSVMVLFMPTEVYGISVADKFLIAATATCTGALLRFPYSMATSRFGGRNWTVFSAAVLLVPVLATIWILANPGQGLWVYLVCAALTGLGGGNFSSSMANISFFFPKERKGSALGVNAGLGNLGVSVVQFLSPLVVTAGIFGVFGGDAQTIVKNGQTAQVWTQNAAFIWVPWIALTALAAWFGMNDIADARASFAAQAAIFKRKHNWLMCVLYLGTFGSFIGYAAGFPLLIKSQFPSINPLAYAWLGPLVGAVVRPFGGWLADKLGGARVTLWNFIVMAIAVVGVTVFLPSGSNEGQFGGFFVCFLVLFLTTGIGNGSTFRMIPVIFLTEAMRGVDKNNAAAVAQANKEGNTLGAATLGFTAAMAAYGGFFIPKSYGSSIALTGAPHAALWCFAAFYLVCIAVTWWYYARKHAEMPC